MYSYIDRAIIAPIPADSMMTVEPQNNSFFHWVIVLFLRVLLFIFFSSTRTSIIVQSSSKGKFEKPEWNQDLRMVIMARR